jgi:DNA-binding CsgD family transcriptional regulator
MLAPRQRPPFGWQSLTPTEHTVVALVADGLSNPQIGERLFISRRTVQTHLVHVFARLGISSRAQLAAQVARQREEGQLAR